MNLHEFIAAADATGYLLTIGREVDPYLEAAAIIAEHDGRPVLLKHVKGSPFPVIAGVCSDRRYFGLALGVPADRVMFRLAEALAEQPERSDRTVPATQSKGAQRSSQWDTPSTTPRELLRDSAQDARSFSSEIAPCQEVVEPEVEPGAHPLSDALYAGDAGAYASAAVAFINDPETGPNASYHRLLRLDRTRVAARLVERRGTGTAWRRSGPDGLPVAICIGLPPHVLLAASMAPPPGVDELTIAQALAPTPLTTCANGIRVPAEAEFVLEGHITHELVPEGPFVDLTGTYDFTRRQPVIEIDRVTHRRAAVYQALLPGKLEHRLLMGMPREPTIYAEVNKVATCLNVHVTPGGWSWLHRSCRSSSDRLTTAHKPIAAAFAGTQPPSTSG